MRKKRYYKPKPVSIALQKEKLEEKYSDLLDWIDLRTGKLSCFIRIRPSHESKEYTVRVEYTVGNRPQAWLVKPVFEKHKGISPLHKYKVEKNGNLELCVFYDRYKEWDESRMFLADTFIPWIVTWLNTYEYWLITGEWEYEESPHGIKKKEGLIKKIRS